MHTGPHEDPSSPSMISGLNSIRPIDNSTRWEIRAGDILHQPQRVNLGIVDICNDRRSDLPEVMRGDFGRHPNSDPITTIHQQVGERSRQNNGLFQRTVKIFLVIDSLLSDVAKQFRCKTCQTRLGIPHCSSGIPVDGPKIALTVYERIAQ